MKKSLLASFVLFLSVFQLFAQTTQTIRGKVIDSSTEHPIVGASVTVVNQNLGVITNENGEFKLEKVKIGRCQVKISSVGYEAQNLAELLVESGKELVLDIRLSESSQQLTEAVVKAASPNLSGALTSLQNITVEQVFRYPATFFDPARLATSFAGVVNDNDQANGMVIRGNSPNSMQWRLEGVEIVNPNHLSNAGTFSDKATQNAGGTNILSAQLLGNMNFLTGAFPAEYGNALSGVMDMRLRKGNDEKHEFTAQTGVIGVDFAAEGPLSKKSKASYLVNYRYSFTGLLSLMGVKFGDEDIRFQDISFNLSFPTKKAGNFTVFGMGGVSSNDFVSKEDKSLWTSEKDQFNIYYGNTMYATGVTHQKNFGEKLLWRTVIANSALETSREQVLNQDKSSIYNQFKKRKTTITTSFAYKIRANNTLKIGAFVTNQFDEMTDRITFPRNSNLTKTLSGTVLQPYMNYQSLLTDKLTLNVGIHYLNYTYNNTSSFEPRVSFGYQLTPSQSISVAYGLHSQMQLPQVYYVYPSNENLGLTKAHHFVLSHNKRLKANSYLKTELYYQKLFNVPVISMATTFKDDITFSSLNAIENIPFNMLANTGTGENYGVEVTYQQYLLDGFYTLINGTFYQSTYKAVDNIERNTRFNGKYIFNATIGKEWTRKKNRTLGVNGRIVMLGGFYETPINETESAKQGQTVYDYSNAFTVKQKDYFRPDLRVYFKKSKTKYSRTWSIDIQNVANYQNVAFSYYDTYLKKVIVKNQLGMIPILNYRWEF